MMASSSFGTRSAALNDIKIRSPQRPRSTGLGFASVTSANFAQASLVNTMASTSIETRSVSLNVTKTRSPQRPHGNGFVSVAPMDNTQAAHNLHNHRSDHKLHKDTLEEESNEDTFQANKLDLPFRRRKESPRETSYYYRKPINRSAPPPKFNLPGLPPKKAILPLFLDSVSDEEDDDEDDEEDEGYDSGDDFADLNGRRTPTCQELRDHGIRDGWINHDSFLVHGPNLDDDVFGFDASVPASSTDSPEATVPSREMEQQESTLEPPSEDAETMMETKEHPETTGMEIPERGKGSSSVSRQRLRPWSAFARQVWEQVFTDPLTTT